MPAEPHGAAEIGPTPVAGPAAGCIGWLGRCGARCDAHGDRPDAGATAAVRDAERLVQIEVRDVGTERARPRDTDERVEVGAVDVDLPARLVHDLAQLDDVLLEHAVRRRVGDHDRREVGRGARRP